MNNSELSAMPSEFTYQVDGVEKHEINTGLTKREYFAGLAMQGCLASDHEHVWMSDDVAEYAVKQADALLLELAK